jgi:hypothetical protein
MEATNSQKETSLWRQATALLSIPSPISAEEIAARAYLKYASQRDSTVSPVEHWLEAERELMREKWLRP